MEIITLTPENIEHEHICCAMSDKKSVEAVRLKKNWLKSRMLEGLKFKKMDIKGKAFIEYLPAENAWVPIEAEGYTFINCFWVSGSHKGRGYGKTLLAECESDSSGRRGVLVIVGKKKMSYLSDKSFFIKQGYQVADCCGANLELLVKRFDNASPMPKFKLCAQQGILNSVRGIDIFYTLQCPFTYTYVNLISPIAQLSEYPVRIHQITTKEEAQRHFCPITTYSVFVDGVYYSNQILTISKLEELIKKAATSEL